MFLYAETCTFVISTQFSDKFFWICHKQCLHLSDVYFQMTIYVLYILTYYPIITVWIFLFLIICYDRHLRYVKTSFNNMYLRIFIRLFPWGELLEVELLRVDIYWCSFLYKLLTCSVLVYNALDSISLSSYCIISLLPVQAE